jgi:hypothetical protein
VRVDGPFARQAENGGSGRNRDVTERAIGVPFKQKDRRNRAKPHRLADAAFDLIEIAHPFECGR